jgi:hypothetical protein
MFAFRDRTLRRWGLTLLVTALVAVGGGRFVDLATLQKIAPVFIAFFGVLTGFLVNAMIRTATALEGAANLSPSDLREISIALKAQQAGWKKLFHLYLTIVVLVIIGSLGPSKYILQLWSRELDLSVIAVTIFFAILAIALIRTLTIVDGLDALQELRAKLLIDAAEKRERADRRRATAEIGFMPGATDPNFGRNVSFPR